MGEAVSPSVGASVTARVGLKDGEVVGLEVVQMHSGVGGGVGDGGPGTGGTGIVGASPLGALVGNAVLPLFVGNLVGELVVTGDFVGRARLVGKLVGDFEITVAGDFVLAEAGAFVGALEGGKGKGDVAGAFVGRFVAGTDDTGDFVEGSFFVGNLVGDNVALVGNFVGPDCGDFVGKRVGEREVGNCVGDLVGDHVVGVVGDLVGNAVVGE